MSFARRNRIVFAVPGRIDQSTSAGCHQLIRDGAILCTGVDDILAELQTLPGLHPAARRRVGSTTSATSLTPALNEPESKAYVAFDSGEMLTLDALLEKTGLPYAELAPALMMPELKKLVAKRLDGTYEARS